MARYFLKNFSLPDTWNLDETFTLRDLIENSQGQVGEIGEYLYSDGTFGAGYKSNAIGRAYYKNDTGCKVVALQDADSTNIIWGPKNLSKPSISYIEWWFWFRISSIQRKIY